MQNYLEELFETREAKLIQKYKELGKNNKKLIELHEEEEKNLKQKDEEISRLKQIIKQAGLDIKEN